MNKIDPFDRPEEEDDLDEYIRERNEKSSGFAQKIKKILERIRRLESGECNPRMEVVHPDGDLNHVSVRMFCSCGKKH